MPPYLLCFFHMPCCLAAIARSESSAAGQDLLRAETRRRNTPAAAQDNCRRFGGVRQPYEYRAESVRMPAQAERTAHGAARADDTGRRRLFQPVSSGAGQPERPKNIVRK